MKIAEVYPIQRLPRRLSAFDYLAPEEKNLGRGFFVTVPLRNKIVLGVVKEVHERYSPRAGLKNISEISNIPALSKTELGFYEWLAKDLAQSVPSILHAAIPLPTKRTTDDLIGEIKSLKIRTSETAAIQRALRIIEERSTAFISAPDLIRMSAAAAAYLHANPKSRIAVLVPGAREAEAVFPYFAAFGAGLITGNESSGRRFKVWQDLRCGEKKVLIGTRSAALLLPESLEAVFLFRSGHESYKSQDRNPRYDARDLAREWHTRTGNRLYFLDSIPRPDDLAYFGEERIFIEHLEPRPCFINLTEERRVSEHPLISWSLDQAVNDCLKKSRRVLCLYNRKGQAALLRCADCGFNFPCPVCGGIFSVYETSIRCHRCGRAEPRPLACPKCNGPRLEEKGFGNQTIKKAFQKQFPETTVSIIDKNIHENKNAQIVLATTFYLESERDFFSRQNFGLIVNLDADLSLLDPGFRAFENSLRFIEDLRGLAQREQAVFIVQTRNPQIFIPYFEKPMGCLKSELALRNSYQVPPFVRWFRLRIRDKEERRAELELKTVIENIKALSGVTAFPIEYEKGRGCSVSVSVEPAAVVTLLEKFSALPDRVIIDTNAIS